MIAPCTSPSDSRPQRENLDSPGPHRLGVRLTADLPLQGSGSSNSCAIEELAGDHCGNGDLERAAARTSRSPKYDVTTGSLSSLRRLVLSRCVEDEEFDASWASPCEVDGLSRVQSRSWDAELPAGLTNGAERDHVERISVAPSANGTRKRDSRAILAVEGQAGGGLRIGRGSELAGSDDENKRNNERTHTRIIGCSFDVLDQPLAHPPLRAGPGRSTGSPVAP